MSLIETNFCDHRKIAKKKNQNIPIGLWNTQALLIIIMPIIFNKICIIFLVQRKWQVDIPELQLPAPLK